MRVMADENTLDGFASDAGLSAVKALSVALPVRLEIQTQIELLSSLSAFYSLKVCFLLNLLDIHSRYTVDTSGWSSVALLRDVLW